MGKDPPSSSLYFPWGRASLNLDDFEHLKSLKSVLFPSEIGVAHDVSRLGNPSEP